MRFSSRKLMSEYVVDLQIEAFMFVLSPRNVFHFSAVATQLEK